MPVTNLLVGLISALVATNQPAAVSNLLKDQTGIVVNIPDPNDPVEKEYHKLTEDDQAALDEVDKWINENHAFAEKGAADPPDVLNKKIMARFEPVRKEYEDFLQRHPDHVRGRLAYASFLDDSGDEDTSVAEYDKVLKLDPKNPVTYNQLANHYSHVGPVDKAFEYYEKAIELDPTESVYYRNLGTMTYLFRKDAERIYNLTEQQVFDKSLAIYALSMKYDSNNFELAQDVAETYYGIKPIRTEAALNAWTNTLKLARNDTERQGVFIHMARFNISAGRYDKGRELLNLVNDPLLQDLKRRGFSNVAYRETISWNDAVSGHLSTLFSVGRKPESTNAPPANVEAH